MSLEIGNDSFHSACLDLQIQTTQTLVRIQEYDFKSDSEMPGLLSAGREELEGENGGAGPRLRVKSRLNATAKTIFLT